MGQITLLLLLLFSPSPSDRVPGGRPGGGPGLLPFLRLSIHTMSDGGGRAGDRLLPLLVMKTLRETSSTSEEEEGGGFVLGGDALYIDSIMVPVFWFTG